MNSFSLIILLIFRASYASVLIIVSFSVERYLAICHPLHMFAMGDFQRGLRVIRYVPCQNWLFWTFLTFLGPFWLSLGHVCYGGLSKRSQSDKVCTMPKLSASIFPDSMSNCNICIGCNKTFWKLWFNFVAAFYWTFVSNFFPIPKIALCKDPVYWPGFFPIFLIFMSYL